jgi:hypothetical protein
VLTDVRRVLTEDGQLFVRTPNATFHVAMCRLSRGVRWPRAIAHALDHAYIFNPLVWTAHSLRALLERTGFRATVGNATLSPDDPYAVLSRSARPVVRAAKAVVSMTSAGAAAISSGRLLISSSLEAWATPPRGPRTAPPSAA